MDGDIQVSAEVSVGTDDESDVYITRSWGTDGREDCVAIDAADLDALIAALTTVREQQQAEGGSRS